MGKPFEIEGKLIAFNNLIEVYVDGYTYQITIDFDIWGWARYLYLEMGQLIEGETYILMSPDHGAASTLVEFVLLSPDLVQLIVYTGSYTGVTTRVYSKQNAVSIEITTSELKSLISFLRNIAG